MARTEIGRSLRRPLSRRRSSLHRLSPGLAAVLGILAGPAQGQNAYITNALDHSVTVIDTTSNTVVATVSLDSSSVPNIPKNITVSFDGKKAYIGERFFRRKNTIHVLDLSTRKIVANVVVDEAYFIGPSLLVSPDNKKLYFALEDRIFTMDTATYDISYKKVPGLDARLLALSSKGKRLYVRGPDDMTVLDMDTYSIVSVIPLVGTWASAIVVAPDDQKIYMPDPGKDSVMVIDAVENTIAAWIHVGKHPSGAAVTPDGKKLYVTALGYNSLDLTPIDETYPNCEVTVIDTATNSVAAHIGCAGNAPVGIAVTPDGREAYVVNGNTNTVSVIDTGTDTIMATLPVGKEPSALGNFIGPAPPP